MAGIEDNAVQRQSFTFYLSFEKAISKLEDGDQLTIYRAIARYSLFGEVPNNLTGFAQLAWDLLEPTLRKSRANYLNGKKGGAPKGNKNNRYSTTQSTTEQQPKYNPKYNTDTYTDTYTYTDDIINSNQRLESKKPSAFSPNEPVKLDNSDFVRVQRLWNSCCPGYRKVTKLTSRRPSRCNRKGAISACLKMLMGTTDNATKEDAFTMLKTAFEKVQESGFLKGDNERGWKATFDWVMKVDNLIKVIEGNYSDAATSAITDIWTD
ncbi:MAG: hypothetical protein IJ020_03225 [Bacteroidaceae bacterium]|nr:hypothetical protein [Bacteroidaceae bacterium]